LFAVCLFSVGSPTAYGVNDVAGSLFTLTNSSTAPNGVWSWFEDERAVIDNSDPSNPLLVLSSVSAGSGAERGDVDILWRNLTTGQQGESELHDQFEQDDHNSAALYLRPDGHYLAMYSKHISDNLTRWRISTNPHDPTAWGPEQTLSNGAGTTYNNIYHLPADNGGAGRTYNFTRTLNFDPNVQVSSDNGSNWTNAGKLLTEGGGGDRPYLRYASDGKKIHFIATDRHPRNFANSVYHGYVQDGKVYNATGELMDDSLFDGSAVAPSSLTTVFENGSQFDGVTMNRAWTINLEIDNTGNPVGIFSARANDNNQDHRFFYARYDGNQWQVNQMAQAGGFLYSAEDDYTGLASIDPSNPNIVYMSSDIDPRDSSSTSKYELYKGITSDFGESWAWTPITENSTIDNLRPVVPEWNGQNTAVAWLRGDYNTYTNWTTDVVGISFAATDPKSLLWRGDATSPNTWDHSTTANWDSGGGLTDVFNNGDEVAFDDTAVSHTVNLPTSVTPTSVAFNNSVASYVITGGGIDGSGRLRVIGGGTVTLNNGQNSYTGETSIAKGTLVLAADASLAATPRILVADDATLDVTAVANRGFTLDNQTLSIAGSVLGKVTATNNSIVLVDSSDSIQGDLDASMSLVAGGGKVQGNLTAQTGASVKVGGDEIIGEAIFTYLDADHSREGNTTTANGSPLVTAPNIWEVRTGIGGNSDSIYEADTNSQNAAPQLRTTLTGLEPNTSYTVYANYWDATGSSWRILAGADSNNLTLYDSPFDSVSGATDGIDPNTLNYDQAPNTAAGNRLMWGAPLGELQSDGNGELVIYIDDTGSSDGDDRTFYDGISYSGGSLVYSGQAVLEIDGDFTQHPGSTLLIDIATSAVHDQLLVTGQANLAGTLAVSLASDAPALKRGDEFQILQYQSSTGMFDSFSLPGLASGLRWESAQLYTNGTLTVAEVLEGDFNGDGTVDLVDYNVWRDSLGKAEDGVVVLSGNGDGGLVSASDFVLWQTNYGSMMAGSVNAQLNAVPEPSTLVVSLLAILLTRRGLTLAE